MFNNKQSSFSKIYLSIYAIAIFIMIFVLDSQISGMFNFSNIINLLFTFFAIIANFFLILRNNNFKVETNDVIFASLILILTILPRLFNVQIMSPFFTMLYLMIINAKYIKANLFITVDFYVRLFAISLVLIFYYLHFFNDSVTLRGINIVRYNLGFNNPNMAGIVFLSLLLSFILIFNNLRINFISIILIIMAIFLFFYIVNITNSRELQFPGIILIALFVLKKIKIIRYIISKSTITILVFTLFVSIISVFILNSDSSLFYFIDHLTTYRISNALAAFQIYPVNLFGHIDTSLLNNVILYNNQHPGIDSTYLSNLMDFGILGLFILIIVYIKGIKIADKYNNYLVNICLIAVFITFTVSQCRDAYAPLIYAFALNNNFRRGVNYE